MIRYCFTCRELYTGSRFCPGKWCRIVRWFKYQMWRRGE